MRLTETCNRVSNENSCARLKLLLSLYSTAVRAPGETLLECVLTKCPLKIKRNIVTALIHCHFTTRARRVTDHEEFAPVIFVFLTAMIVFWSSDALWFGVQSPTFRRKILPEAGGLSETSAAQTAVVNGSPDHTVIESVRQ